MHNINLESSAENPMPKRRSANLKLVKGEQAEEKRDISISNEELESVCDLEVTQREKNDIISQTNWLQTLDEHRLYLHRLYYDLNSRNISEELPVTEKTFRFRRNLDAVKKLKQSIYKLTSDKTLSEPENYDKYKALFDDLVAFVVLEKRKADWLEQNFYPVIYDKVLKTAKAEVMQFLIKEKNSRKLDSFPDISSIPVNLMDILNYDLAGNNPRSAGVYNGHEIQIAIPSHFTDKEEWRVFEVVVHELVHAASFKSYDRLGLHQHQNDPDFEEVNEAVTEMVTFFIMRDHLTQFKTSLLGERNHPLYLSNLSYSEYTTLVKDVLNKVPFHFFTDAMFNRDGLENLKGKFAEEYGQENALRDFAEKLKNLYQPKRKARKIISLKEAAEKIREKKTSAEYRDKKEDE